MLGLAPHHGRQHRRNPQSIHERRQHRTCSGRLVSACQQLARTHQESGETERGVPYHLSATEHKHLQGDGGNNLTLGMTSSGRLGLAQRNTAWAPAGSAAYSTRTTASCPPTSEVKPRRVWLNAQPFHSSIRSWLFTHTRARPRY